MRASLHHNHDDDDDDNPFDVGDGGADDGGDGAVSDDSISGCIVFPFMA